MSAPALLAIDQGTTSSRAILFSAAGDRLASAQKELSLHYPQKGWVEADPRDIWEDTLWACRRVLRDKPEAAKALAGAGITNQRETTILWDRTTGEPIYNAIIWQDRRTAALCQRLKEQGHEDMVRARTGLLLDPYFSASKIAWILENVPGAREKATAGELAFGTVDTWLLWHFSQGAVHATDITNASRTLLYNIREQKWDAELLALFDIPESLLPGVHDNAHPYVTTDMLGPALTIGGVAGDQQAAVIGQGCFTPGMVKSTYGTGCFALMNIGPDFRESQNKLLTTPAYRLNGQITYAIEGSIFVAGAAVQFLRDNLGFFRDAAQSESLATSVPDNNGVYFVPAFTGLGAPHWQPEARALISGLSRESTSAHITRAALEAQAYQTHDLMSAMEEDGGHSPEVIRADGGLTANGFMCQFLADMLGKPVEVPEVAETTAWGAACLAGLQSEVFAGLEDVAAGWSCARRYEPDIAPATRTALLEGWQAALGKVLG